MLIRAESLPTDDEPPRYGLHQANQYVRRNSMMTDDANSMKDKIKELVRTASLSCIEDQSQQQGFVLEEVGDNTQAGQVLGNMMSIILITGDALRITLKLHFSMQNARQLSYSVYRRGSAAEVEDGKAIDFVKELSNLIAGQLVRSFESVKIPMGISLPLCTRGFYEVFADYSPTETPLIRFSDVWRLSLGDACISGSVMYEISNIDMLSPVADIQNEEEPEDDDAGFDFL